MRSLSDKLPHPNRWLMDQLGSRRRGQIMIMFAFGFVALIACVALATDLGVLVTTRRSWQKIADTCAVVGAQSATASPRALACTVSNNIPTGVTVNNPPSKGLYIGNNDYTEVIISRNAPTIFMRALGIQTVPIEVRAVAHNRIQYDFGVMGLQPGVEAVKSSGGSSGQINGNACSAGDFKVAGNLNIAGYAFASGTFSGNPTSSGVVAGPGAPSCTDPGYPLPTPIPAPQTLPLPGALLNVVCVSPTTIAPPAARIRIQCPADVTVQVAGPRIEVDITGSNHARVRFMPNPPSPSNATFQDVSIQGDGPIELAPGWYDNIRVASAGPNITMQPGLYLINSSYDQAGSGTLTGAGVSIVVGKKFDKSGSGDTTLSCCAPEMQNNVLIYHTGQTLPLPLSSPTSPWTATAGANSVTLSGNNNTIQVSGNIYSPLSAPCDDPCVSIGGASTNMTINGQVAASTVGINGTGLNVTFTGTGTQPGRSYLAE